MKAQIYEVKIRTQDGSRWFTDNEFWDIYLWESEETGIYGLQLCYSTGTSEERALTWFKEGTFTHNKVDLGLNTPTSNHAPILVADGSFRSDELIDKFKRSSQKLDSELKDFIIQKMQDFNR